MIYEWKKGFWTRPIQIIRDGQQVGRLVYDSGFTMEATALLVVILVVLWT